jgi:hypothetical protein
MTESSEKLNAFMTQMEPLRPGRGIAYRPCESSRRLGVRRARDPADTDQRQTAPGQPVHFGE